MSKQTFEDVISEKVASVLTSGYLEKVIEDKVSEAVGKVVSELFGWGGSCNQLLKSKLEEVMVPVIESHDFNDYLVKIDSVLSELVTSSCLPDNKKILESFQYLMEDNKMEEITLSDIFEQYIKHVEDNIDTSDLEIEYDDEPTYQYVRAECRVSYEEESTSSYFHKACITFSCEYDTNLTISLDVYKGKSDSKWKIFKSISNAINVFSLRYMSKFEIFLTKLDVSRTEIVLDKDYLDCDEVQPSASPE